MNILFCWVVLTLSLLANGSAARFAGVGAWDISPSAEGLPVLAYYQDILTVAQRVNDNVTENVATGVDSARFNLHFLLWVGGVRYESAHAYIVARGSSAGARGLHPQAITSGGFGDSGPVIAEHPHVAILPYALDVERSVCSSTVQAKGVRA